MNIVIHGYKYNIDREIPIDVINIFNDYYLSGRMLKSISKKYKVSITYITDLIINYNDVANCYMDAQRKFFEDHHKANEISNVAKKGGIKWIGK